MAFENTITIGLTVTPVVPPEEGFLLTSDPARQTVPVGTVATYQIGIDPTAAFAGPVQLEVLDAPAGAVWELVPLTISVGEVATLTVVTDGIAPSETEYLFSVRGVRVEV